MSDKLLPIELNKILGRIFMGDDIFNPRKRLLTDKETVELVEVVEASIELVSTDKTHRVISPEEKSSK